jgi:hypothetical protein
MNPVDTLRIVLDHQAAMRREARIHSLARSARHRHHGVTAGDAAGAAGADADPVGPRQFLDR